jgi:hypothetical protein
MSELILDGTIRTADISSLSPLRFVERKLIKGNHENTSLLNVTAQGEGGTLGDYSYILADVMTKINHFRWECRAFIKSKKVG